MFWSSCERPGDALLSFQRALKLKPRHWDAAYQSAFLLQRIGAVRGSAGAFQPVRRSCSRTMPRRCCARAALQGLKRLEESLADNRRAHALDPANADTCNNTGDALQSLGRYEEALPWFDKALALRPDFVEALDNKAVALTQLHRFDEAFAIHDRLKRIGVNTAPRRTGICRCFIC